jgi:hypothetical protein
MHIRSNLQLCLHYPPIQPLPTNLTNFASQYGSNFFHKPGRHFFVFFSSINFLSQFPWTSSVLTHRYPSIHHISVFPSGSNISPHSLSFSLLHIPSHHLNTFRSLLPNSPHRIDQPFHFPPQLIKQQSRHFLNTLSQYLTLQTSVVYQDV